MADGLAARACAVDVGGAVLGEDTEGCRGKTLGGDVDVGAVERGGSCVEEGLGECLLNQLESRNWMISFRESFFLFFDYRKGLHGIRTIKHRTSKEMRETNPIFQMLGNGIEELGHFFLEEMDAFRA